MTAIIDIAPELLTTRSDVMELAGLLDSCVSPHASAANELNSLVREITDSQLPETLTESARAVVASSNAEVLALRLSQGVKHGHDNPRISSLSADVLHALVQHTSSMLAHDDSLWMNWSPSRAAQPLAPHT